MTKKKFTRKPAPSAKRRNEPLSWKFFITTILFGVLLAAGFFFAATQQFFSMDYGIQNSRLRSEIEDLRSKNRRLRLEKEIALSPESIRMSARELGLTATTVRNLEPMGGAPGIEVAANQEAPEVAPPPVRTYIKETKKTESVPRSVPASRPEPKIIKTVQAERVKTAEAPAPEKAEDASKATRSRIIDINARR